MKLTIRVLTVGSALLIAASVNLANAQFRDAGSKIRGEAMAGHEVQTYQRHAQDRAQMLYYYSQAPQPIPKQQAQELVAGVRKDLTAAEKALEKIKVERAKDKEVLDQIALIKKHQAKASEVCGMAEELCAKEHGDHVAVGDCCGQMWHELDAAQAETQKLLKMLKIEKLAAPPKGAVKPVEAAVKK